MRKIFSLIIISLLIILSATGCSQTSKAQSKNNLNSHNFAIYLLKNWDGYYGVNISNIYTLNEKELDKLTLDDEPILTDEDLTAYYWEMSDLNEEGVAGAGLSKAKHMDLLEFKNNKVLIERLQKKTNSITAHLPFVAVANGEKIYVGAFFSPLSNLSFPQGIHIAIDYLMQPDDSKCILRENASTDLIHDKRIYDALKKVNKIKE